jgi:hypothetical protein
MNDWNVMGLMMLVGIFAPAIIGLIVSSVNLIKVYNEYKKESVMKEDYYDYSSDEMEHDEIMKRIQEEGELMEIEEV